MLAPFAHPSSKIPLNRQNLIELSPKCLLEGTDAKIQKVQLQKSVEGEDDGLIREGSHVMLFSTRDNINSIIVQKGAIFDNRHGHFHHNDLIGLPYGARIYARKPAKGWLVALKPTSELWTLGCTHRTEILYLSDVSMILSNLNIKPGSIVIETGTGTGSLSTAFITALQPTGRLYTFEYHDVRAKSAASDFSRNGLAPWVTVTHRDTIATGFPAELDNKVDAVFLDLPAPWVVVPSAKKALKHDAMFCSFSPCIEQIQQTAEKLAELGFVNIETIECLQRSYDCRSISIKQDNELWKIDHEKKNDVEAENTTTTIEIDEQQTEEDKSNLKKRSREEVTDTNESKQENVAYATDPTSNEPKQNKQKSIPFLRPAKRGKGVTADSDPSTIKLVARPFPEMRGHTGYLIFARNYDLAKLEQQQ